MQRLRHEHAVLPNEFAVEPEFAAITGGGFRDVVDPALSLLSMPSDEIECNPDDEGCSPDGTMIVEGDPLPDDEIQLIEDWIVCGAPE